MVYKILKPKSRKKRNRSTKDSHTEQFKSRKIRDLNSFSSTPVKLDYKEIRNPNNSFTQKSLTEQLKSRNIRDLNRFSVTTPIKLDYTETRNPNRFSVTTTAAKFDYQPSRNRYVTYKRNPIYESNSQNGGQIQLIKENDSFNFNDLSIIRCPITMSIFVNPVLTEDGNSYEKYAIEQHFKKTNISPLTNKRINTKLIPNNALKQIISNLIVLHKDLENEYNETKQKYKQIFTPIVGPPKISKSIRKIRRLTNRPQIL